MFSLIIASLLIDYLDKVFLGIKNGGAKSSIQVVEDIIFLPITQLQMILSMAIAEILLLSEPSYSVTIGSENYFSLAVGAFVAGIFIFLLIALKVGTKIRFKQVEPQEKIPIRVRQN